MSLRSSVAAFAFCMSSFFLVPRAGHALPLPDNNSPCSAQTCLSISNQYANTGTAIYAFTNKGYAFDGWSYEGTAVHAGTYAGMGVRGTSTLGIAVLGESTGNVGVYGWSGGNNGIRGYTGSTTNAAISAISPSTTGVAFWGQGSLQLNGYTAQKIGGGQWSAYSDVRLKKDVHTLDWGLEELRRVRPVTYKYNGLGDTTDDGREFVGVIAQELEQVFPSMVTARKGKLHAGDAAETDIKIVDPSAFTFVLINAVKEQQELIERQERRIAALERGGGAWFSASIPAGGLGTGLALGLLSLGLVALRRQRAQTR